MRYLAALMIAGVMVGGMSATRADDPPAQKRRRIPPQILQQFDKNGDGKLDEAEKRAIRDSFMKRFDKNGDGKIDEAEKRAAREAFMKRRGGPGKDGKGRPGKGRPGRFDRQAILKRFDKNGDGKLDEAERQAAREAFMKRRGGPGKDGKGRPGKGRPGQFDRAAILKQFDKNGDGKLDEAERQAAREAFMKRRGGPGKAGKGRPGKGRPGGLDRAAILKQFDKNGDGKLDEAERQAAREAFMKRRGGRDRGKFGQGRPGGPVDGPKPRIDRAKLIEQFDADGDGKLSPEERRKAMETLRKKRGKDEE